MGLGKGSGHLRQSSPVQWQRSPIACRNGTRTVEKLTLLSLGINFLGTMEKEYETYNFSLRLPLNLELSSF